MALKRMGTWIRDSFECGAGGGVDNDEYVCYSVKRALK